MVAYNFQKQFAPLVETGQKRQTIRALRKTRHAKAGEPVQLYTGMRTKGCRKLIDPDPLCSSNTHIEITESDIIGANGIKLPRIESLGDERDFVLDKFAELDGFKDFENMKAWFRKAHGLPFVGRLIKWELAND
ncbi:MAG: hypothetical protein AAFW60_01895 [Pseudomonadota bacterium]